MNNRTLRITYGAMLAAVFALLLLLNRQTGGMLEGLLLFVLPIPMTAYAVYYGGRASVVVFAVMVMLSFLFGNFTSIFYAVSAALVGLVQGTRIYHKRNMTHTLFLIMLMDMVAELIAMVILARLVTGVGLEADVKEMQTMLEKTFQMSGVKLPSGVSPATLFPKDAIRRLVLISIALTGALEGFITFELSVIILKKLRVPVPRQQSLRDYFPPRWLGFLAIAAFLEYNITFARPLANETLQGIAQTVGIIGYFYLMIFGIIALSGVLRAWVTKSKPVVILFTILGMFLVPLLILLLGVMYLVGGLHERILERERGDNERR